MKEKVSKEKFPELLGLLGTDIAVNFAERIFDVFSSDKKNIKLPEYLKYVDIYHHGDESERCKVTFRLMDKSDTGVITKTDFEEYLNLIIAAIKKVHPTATDNLLTSREIEILFRKISDGKEVFTNIDFENIYHKKPELLSWIDYFKHNDEDVLYLINKNLKKLIQIQGNFFENMTNIMTNILSQGENLYLEDAIKEIDSFCEIVEHKKKKFLYSGSVFNIRTVFENLTKSFNENKGVNTPMKEDIIHSEKNVNSDKTDNDEFCILS